MSISTISANEFIRKSESAAPPLCVVDVRNVPEIQAASLPGTVNIPLDGLTAQRLNDKLARCDIHPHHVYLLCQGGVRARAAAQRLEGQVSAELVVIEGGVNALKQAGASLRENHQGVMSIERQVRIAAGSLVLLGLLLAVTLSPWFVLLSAFVGGGLVVAGITDSCLMGRLLMHFPWNK